MQFDQIKSEEAQIDIEIWKQNYFAWVTMRVNNLHRHKLPHPLRELNVSLSLTCFVCVFNLLNHMCQVTLVNNFTPNTSIIGIPKCLSSVSQGFALQLMAFITFFSFLCFFILSLSLSHSCLAPSSMSSSIARPHPRFEGEKWRRKRMSTMAITFNQWQVT